MLRWPRIGAGHQVHDGADPKPSVSEEAETIFPLLLAGFSLFEIETLYNDSDVRTYHAILSAAQKQNEIRRLQQKLDIAEAFNHAYVGSKPGAKRGDRTNQRMYDKWQRKIEREIAKKRGQGIVTVWDQLGKSRKL